MSKSIGKSPVSSHRSSTAAYLYTEHKYRLMKTLGIGAFSKVKLAVHIPTGQKVALKIMNRHRMRDMEEKVRRELMVMKLVAHPHVVRLYEVIETPTEICMVMEYVESGDLFDYIVLNGRLSEDESRHFFQQIIAGVDYCHTNRVVHRDLKPENLLLDQKRSSIKIADFGLSNIMRDGQFLKSSCGSPNYAAPEMIQRHLYAGPEVDVWSCGVALYAMLCGVLPFDDENISSLYRKIIDCMYMLPSHLSVEARDLITRILKADPLQRITIAEIRRHPFFQTKLPRYIALPPAETAYLVKRIDEDIMLRVEKMGFDRMSLAQSLLLEKQSKATVAYYLLLDSQEKKGFDEYLEGEFEELEVTTSPLLPSQVSGAFSAYSNEGYDNSFQSVPGERSKFDLSLQIKKQKDIQPRQDFAIATSSARFYPFPHSQWSPRPIAFGTYNLTGGRSQQEAGPRGARRLGIQVLRPLLMRLTKDIVDTYQVCNPSFEYSESYNPKRFVESPVFGTPTNWQKGKLLGSGTFGNVYVGFNNLQWEFLCYERGSLGF